MRREIRVISILTCLCAAIALAGCSAAPVREETAITELKTAPQEQSNSQDATYTIRLEPWIMLEEGERTTLSVTVSPEGLEQDVVWSSDDTAVATVENGVVTGIKEGNTLVKASLGTKESSCNVFVYASEDSETAKNSTSEDQETEETFTDSHMLSVLPISIVPGERAEIEYGQTCEADLDGDGELETLSCGGSQWMNSTPDAWLLIDSKDYSGQIQSELHELGYFAFDNDQPYLLMDLDGSDPYLEIVLPLLAPNMHRGVALYRFTGTELILLGDLDGYVCGSNNTDNFLTHEPIVFHDDGTVETYTISRVMQKWYVTATYVLEGDQLTLLPQEFYTADWNVLDVNQPDWGRILTAQYDLRSYPTPDLSATSGVLPKDTVVEVLACDLENWVQMQRQDTGETIYLYFFSDDEQTPWNKNCCYAADGSVITYPEYPFSNLMLWE